MDSVMTGTETIQQLRQRPKQTKRPFLERADQKTRKTHENASRNYKNGFDMVTRASEEAEASINKELTGARDAVRALFREHDPALREEALRLAIEAEATGTAHVTAQEAFQAFMAEYYAFAQDCDSPDVAVALVPSSPVEGYVFRNWCARVRAILQPAPAKPFMARVFEALKLD